MIQNQDLKSIRRVWPQKYTRAHKPLKMVYIKEFATKSEAMKEECRIKKLTRKQKEQLIKDAGVSTI